MSPNSTSDQLLLPARLVGEDPHHAGVLVGEDPHHQGDELVITRQKPKTEKPSLYKVILLNDDFTPMDFVILILKKFFMKSDAEANRIMMQVHQEGAGLAGIYTFEVAETKVYSVNEFSQRQKHPLKCTMEKE